MKRSSISIWKHSRSQFEGLPDCPDDLSEPQYAEFLFGKTCTVSLVFHLSLRLHCSLIPLSFANGTLCPTLSFGTLELGAVPDVYLKSTSFSVPFISSACIKINRFPSNIYGVNYPRSVLDSIRAIILTKSSKYFLNLKLYMFYRTYCWIGRYREKFVYPRELHQRWEVEYAALDTATQRTSWASQKLEERKAINAVRVMKRFENGTNPLLLLQHAKLCEQWIESVKVAQVMEKMALIDNRKAMCVYSLLYYSLHSFDV